MTDGDTLSISTSNRDFDFPLRLLEIDAPEMNEEGGSEAKEWLRNRLEGEDVRIMIQKDNRVGKYGRLLGKIFFGGLDIGQQMLYLGLAVPFGKKNEGGIPPFSKLMREVAF